MATAPKPAAGARPAAADRKAADGQETAARKETGIAFLLAQLGAFAAGRFGERAAEAGFTPPEAGLLRLISWNPGQSQQLIAAQLGTRPSRLVALIDGLEERGLAERRRNTEDRRNYALHLTEAGRHAMSVLGQAAAGHEAAMTAPLTPAERRQLSELLSKLAAAHGLRPGVHPGYQHLPSPDHRETSGAAGTSGAGNASLSDGGAGDGGTGN